MKLQESELKILELQKQIATLKENRGDDRKSSAEAQENECNTPDCHLTHRT